MTTNLSNAAVNAEADALAALANLGYIRIYDGLIPISADTAIGAQVLLAELRFGATAFPAAVNGVLTANAITADAAANAAGTASWARCLKSDGTTVICDLSVGTATSNMILNTTTISVGLNVACSSLTLTVAKSTAGS